jgi:hypothetical protein
VFATIVQTDTSTILTGRIRVEIPRGSLDYQYITAHTAHKDLEKAMSVVLQESFRKPIDAAATNYEGRSRAPSQGV